MEKPTPTDAPLIDAIRRRWSPRAFSDRPVSEADRTTLLEAARWAASCKNEQPWRFVYGHAGTPAHDALVALLDDWNDKWAPAAPLLVLVAAKKAFDGDGQQNAHAWYDCGQATAQLAVQAASMDLFVHQMAGFDWRGAPEALGFPEGFAAVAMVAIGHPGDADTLPDNLAKLETGPRKRLPLDEIAFEGRFG